MFIIDQKRNSLQLKHCAKLISLRAFGFGATTRFDTHGVGPSTLSMASIFLVYLALSRPDLACEKAMVSELSLLHSH